MGYLMSSFMHFYSMGHGELMKLPIYTFWEMSRNMDRIRAEEDLRFMSTLSSIFDKEQTVAKKLQQDIGTIYETSDEDIGFDKGAFGALKLMMAQNKA